LIAPPTVLDNKIAANDVAQVPHPSDESLVERRWTRSTVQVSNAVDLAGRLRERSRCFDKNANSRTTEDSTAFVH
jgi:hypothetical protein